MRSPDAQFSDPALARIYDDVDGRREDLELYIGVATELAAQSVLDVGCGTGSLAIRLAELGLDVTGVDPAAASIDVARTKPSAARVRWVVGDASSLLPARNAFDLVVMTGNVAQVFVDDEAWNHTLVAIRNHLSGTGVFVFETRDPAARAWERWDTGAEPTVHDTVAGIVRFRRDVLEVDERAGLVTFRGTYRFEGGSERRSTSTLRFRDMGTLEADLRRAGLTVADVRDAPDRPGLEFVVVARPDARDSPG